MQKLSWLEFTPEEFIEKRAEYPAVYMPYGLAECHGVYNCMGVDWYSAEMICRRAAEKHGGIVAPGMPWHCDEEPEFNWSVRANKMGEFIGAAVGLIPNCAVSVACAQMYAGGAMSSGALMASSFAGSGLGLLVLFRTNRNHCLNLIILLSVYFSGVVLGLLTGGFL